MVREINMNHICKIEGHAHLSLKIEKNKVISCELKASEGARFFEALVLGKKIEDIQEIVSRICGICSCSHSVASIQGLEEALGVAPTKQQKFIREVLLLGERIRSHATHLYFLSLPDFLGASSVLSLGSKHKSKINDALKIISVGNKIVEDLGGRDMHPFLKIREEFPMSNFDETLDSLRKSKDAIMRTIDLFSSLKYPQMERETDYLCLKEKDFYTNISGKVSSAKESFLDNDYKKHLEENVKEYATSKFVLHNNKPYMLGAMSRINNNSSKLTKETKKVLDEVLKKMNLNLPLKNPNYNLICQAVELLEAVNRVMYLIMSRPDARSLTDIKPKAGHGVSAVEAPRGTLFHEYKIGEDGKIKYCNIITPTAQNLNMMEKDITILVEILLEKGFAKEKIVENLEKLIRAYDPCFSCSTHFLKVNWL